VPTSEVKRSNQRLFDDLIRAQQYAPYFSEVLIELLAVPDPCARPKVSRMAATKLP